MTAVRVSVGAPVSLDPANGFDHDATFMLRFLTDPLVEFTPDGSQPRPAAASGWSVDDDGRRVVFRLRDGVRFHHGRPVTADDYVYSLSRAVRPETGSKTAYNLALIDGYEEVRSGAEHSLRGVRALDPATLEVRLVEPFHEIAAVFTHRVASAVPREVVEADPAGFVRRPVSTGPYLLDPDAEPGTLRLRRFPGYHGANSAYGCGGAGYTDELVFSIYDDPEEAVEDWLRDRLHVTRVPPARIGSARDEGANFTTTPALLLQYVGLPLCRPPFDDVAVRRAIAMSIDRERIVADCFHGLRPIANRIVPPGLLDEDADTDLTGVRYDPEGARALLRDHGITALPPTALHHAGGLGQEPWVAAVVADLRRGLDWEIRTHPMPWDSYLDWAPGADAPFIMTWGVDYPSIDNIVYPLLHSDSIGADNYAGFRDTRVDRLIARARATRDPDERRGHYVAAERIACTEMAVVPLWFGVDCHLVRFDLLDVHGRAVDACGDPSLRLYRLHADGSLCRNFG